MRTQERQKDEIANADPPKIVAPAVSATSVFTFITGSNLMNVQQRSGSYFSGELAKHIITQR